MLAKYMKNKKFNDWITNECLIGKLMDTPKFYSLVLEDFRRYEILIFDGQIFSYKFFNIVLSNNYPFTFVRYQSKPKKVHHIEERQRITECLIKNHILVEEFTDHLYYKNAKPHKSVKRGRNYDQFLSKFYELDFNSEISILDIIADE